MVTGKQIEAAFIEQIKVACLVKVLLKFPISCREKGLCDLHDPLPSLCPSAFVRMVTRCERDAPAGCAAVEAWHALSLKIDQPGVSRSYRDLDQTGV